MPRLRVSARDVDAKGGNDHAVAVDHLRRLVIALLGAGRDRLAPCLGRERHRDVVRRQGLRRRRGIRGAAD
jgi:hypothetical protein